MFAMSLVTITCSLSLVKGFDMKSFRQTVVDTTSTDDYDLGSVTVCRAKRGSSLVEFSILVQTSFVTIKLVDVIVLLPIAQI